LEEAVELQRAKVELINTEIANTPETLRTREQARTLAEAEVALLDLQTQSIERQKGLLDEVNAIRNEQKAKVGRRRRRRKGPTSRSRQSGL
jgi:hypothetical protein